MPPLQQIGSIPGSRSRKPPLLLSALPPSTLHYRLALLASLALLLAVVAAVPFARIPLLASPAFVVFQQAVLMTNDLVTAGLLFAHYAVQRSPRLHVLAAGYLFTALIVIPHALSYPGVISPLGPFGGPQGTAWLYVAWRAVLPLAIIAYALRPDGDHGADSVRGSPRPRIVGAILAVAGTIASLVLITAFGSDWLPVLMKGDHFATGARVAMATVFGVTLIALLLLLRRRSRSILDLWLMVVVFAWFCADTLGAFLNGGRYDLGYYAGRLYSLLASSFVLLVLLFEMTTLYLRAMRLARAERIERERRFREMQRAVAEAERAERLMAVAKHGAEEANRTKSEFLAAMSHEIRTPLTSILGMADLLTRTALTAEQRRHIAVLKEAGESLVAITDEVLDISKIEAGKLVLERVAFSPAAATADAVALVRPSAAAKGLELRSELAADLPRWIEGDPARLRQVLLNLLSNGIKFTEHGSVVLRAMRMPGAESRFVRFEVADTGVGIEPAKQRLLFERFSQASHSTYRRFGGTGLGLAISRDLVEAMGGTIEVNSRVGAGSTFWFTLPLVEAEAPGATEQSGPAVDTVPHARILVAEDHPKIRDYIHAVLVDAGHEVVSVKNGAEAVAAVAAREFDLVLMDVGMPEMDGIAATRRIRAMDGRVRDIPIIALTAYAMPEDIERCRLAGANEHLAKPPHREKMLHLVAQWSASRGTPGARAR